MAKKKQSEAQHIDVLHNHLELQIQEPTNRVQVFFNLLYLEPPLNVILAQNPLRLLKDLSGTNEGVDVNEACALILACNTQNLEIFLKIPSFLALCANFCNNFSQFPAKYYGLYLQCLQTSILHHLDTKTIKAILKHIKALRENGIITFHDQKCIETAMQADRVRTEKAFTPSIKETNVKTSQITSFLHFNPAKTPLKIQLDFIMKAKNILKATEWTKKLTYLCDDNFMRNVVMLGPRHTGKSTLLATILHDGKKGAHSPVPLEAIAPILYHYGKSLVHVDYMQPSDLQSLQESPVAKTAAMFKTLEEDYHAVFKSGHEKVAYEKFYETFYETQKIHLAEHVSVSYFSNVLKYVNFINTPSLIPVTFRHIQVYECLAKSDIALYFIRPEAISGDTSAYKQAIKTLTRLVERDNLLHVYVIATHMDKMNITLRKRQDFCLKIKKSIEKSLVCSESLKLAKIKKLHFHFIALSVAYAMRVDNSAAVLESGFDLASSGILELEKQLAGHIFDTPLTHFNIKLLQNTLELCHSNYLNQELSVDPALSKKLIALAPTTAEAAKKRILVLKELCQEILKKLPAQHSALYDSFANLRDNLYAQFIQSLNYEVQQNANFDSERLKTSLTESLVIGLHELSKILQNYLFSLPELHLISNTLDPNNETSLICFAHTPYHKKMLQLMFEQFKQSAKQDFFDESNALVAEHLAYRLNRLLPRNIKSIDIQEDSVIKPIKESFDYYFLALDRNIGNLIGRKIDGFYAQLGRMERILEAYFVAYYQDFSKSEIDDFERIMAGIIHGGVK